MRLTPELIRLDCPPADKMAAIAQAAELLTDAGCVEEPFRYGMIAREAKSNTYLGAGITLPHGMAQTDRHVRESGIAVCRYAEGIPWGPQAEKADLVIAVAAHEEEYDAFLHHLLGLMQDDARLARLKSASNPQDIIELLALTPSSANAQSANHEAADHTDATIPAPDAPAPANPPDTPAAHERASSKLPWYLAAVLLALVIYALSR